MTEHNLPKPEPIPYACMVDIETLGVRPTSQIVSIGAVMFDHTGLKNEFYMSVDLKCYDQDVGFTVDGGTIAWWMQQSQEARAVFSLDTTGIFNVLQAFANWYHYNSGTWIWANGTDFDCIILEHAFKVCGIKVPWKYNAKRDFRTMARMYPTIKAGVQYEGTSHNALDDAMNQARHLVHILVSQGLELR